MEGWWEGAAILLAVLIVVLVTSWNEYSKARQFTLLNAQAKEREVAVVRGGNEAKVSVFNLVVGDVLVVGNGDIVPVDGLLFRCHNIITDESSITGESEDIPKSLYTPSQPCNPFLFSGSKVLEGSGSLLVCAVGLNSFQGKAQSLMEESEEEKTPLQEKLEIIADDIGKIGVAAGLLTFLALTVYVLISIITDGFSGGDMDDLLDAFIIMITIIVVAVPEGLPLAVTLSLAYSVGKMKEENNFVRHLQACETMGGADNICSDKTGTMTESSLKVVKLYVENRSLAPSDPLPPSFLSLFSLSIAHNSTASLLLDPPNPPQRLGNVTELALLDLLYSWQVDYKTVRNPEKVLAQFPFSSSKKRMTTYVRLNDNKAIVLVKGAAEDIIPMCSYVSFEGEKHALTGEDQGKLQEVVKDYSQEALRCIVLAYAETEDMGESRREELEKDLTFLAVVGMEDKVREGVPEAVILAQRAGVVVRMVTGDSVETSIKVAKHCNLLPSSFTYPSNGFFVMEGQDFRRYTGGLVTTQDDQGKTTHSVRDLQAFEEVVGELRVLARSSPEDKFLLVCGLKQCGHVVAVTGDGSNDAPALRKADVGLSMNIVGTPLAKEAADILLMDDNFASIITSIKWGRNIYDCVRKFLQFQLTTNIVALIMCFVGAVITQETPLTAVQMLWVNMIMDSFAALALATESPSDELLSRPPYSRTESIITPDMWLTILSMAGYQIVWLAVIFFLGGPLLSLHGQEKDTFFFHTFVLLQVFNEINCRKLKASELNVFKGITKQPIFNLIFFGTIVCQLLLVQFGGDPVGCEPLTIKQQGLCFFVGASTLPAAFLIKVGPTLYRRRTSGESR